MRYLSSVGREGSTDSTLLFPYLAEHGQGGHTYFAYLADQRRPSEFEFGWLIGRVGGGAGHSGKSHGNIQLLNSHR